LWSKKYFFKKHSFLKRFKKKLFYIRNKALGSKFKTKKIKLFSSIKKPVAKKKGFFYRKRKRKIFFRIGAKILRLRFKRKSIRRNKKVSRYKKRTFYKKKRLPRKKIALRFHLLVKRAFLNKIYNYKFRYKKMLEHFLFGRFFLY
jgi:hypothetical protein